MLETFKTVVKYAHLVNLKISTVRTLSCRICKQTFFATTLFRDRDNLKQIHKTLKTDSLRERMWCEPREIFSHANKNCFTVYQNVIKLSVRGDPG